MMPPLVSVLMTAYNREKYIGEAIESVLASSYSNFEFIIVDDCSSDNTVDIINAFAQKDKRIQIHVNEKNLGQFANRNKAALLAKGTYLKYFDSDDLMHRDMLEVMMDGVNKFPEAAFGAVCDWRMLKSDNLPVLFSNREAYINHYFRGCDILYAGPSGAIYKTQIFNYFGGFNTEIGTTADTLLSLQLASLAPVIAFKSDLFFWRRHDSQVSVGQNDFFEMTKERYLLNVTVLMDINCPFSKREVDIVMRNIKNIFLRKFFKSVVQINSSNKIFHLLKLYDISLSDVLKTMWPNKSIQ